MSYFKDNETGSVFFVITPVMFPSAAKRAHQVRDLTGEFRVCPERPKPVT
jgi:hypothetical protein